MYDHLCEFLPLPDHIVSIVLQYTSSPTSTILRASKYYHHPSPYRKLKEVSHFPRLCSTPIRMDYYWIYRETFFDFLRNANLDIDMDNPLFKLPSYEEFEV